MYVITYRADLDSNALFINYNLYLGVAVRSDTRERARTHTPR